jgi:hypothetical protein
MKSLGQRIGKVVASVDEDDASRLSELASLVHDHLSQKFLTREPDHPAHAISTAVLSRFQAKQTEQQSMVKDVVPTDVSKHLNKTGTDTGVSVNGKSAQSDDTKHDFEVCSTEATKATQAELDKVYDAYQAEAQELWKELKSKRGRSRGRDEKSELREKVNTMFDEIEGLFLQGVSLG